MLPELSKFEVGRSERVSAKTFGLHVTDGLVNHLGRLEQLQISLSALLNMSLTTELEVGKKDIQE